MKWVIVGWFCANAIARVLMIGRDRTPVTHGEAVFSLCICALLIAGTLHEWSK